MQVLSSERLRRGSGSELLAHQHEPGDVDRGQVALASALLEPRELGDRGVRPREAPEEAVAARLAAAGAPNGSCVADVRGALVNSVARGHEKPSQRLTL